MIFMAMGDDDAADILQFVAPDLLEKRRAAVKQTDEITDFHLIADAFACPGKGTEISEYMHSYAINHD
jgi:hypothetical protein